MAEEVKAWKAQDGSLHETEAKADEHSCKALLTKTLSNPGLVSEIMKQPKMVYDALHHIYGNKNG